jgi:hypothetical protein
MYSYDQPVLRFSPASARSDHEMLQDKMRAAVELFDYICNAPCFERTTIVRWPNSDSDSDSD